MTASKNNGDRIPAHGLWPMVMLQQVDLTLERWHEASLPSTDSIRRQARCRFGQEHSSAGERPHASVGHSVRHIDYRRFWHRFARRRARVHRRAGTGTKHGENLAEQAGPISRRRTSSRNWTSPTAASGSRNKASIASPRTFRPKNRKPRLGNSRESSLTADLLQKQKTEGTAWRTETGAGMCWPHRTSRKASGTAAFCRETYGRPHSWKPTAANRTDALFPQPRFVLDVIREAQRRICRAG